MALQDKLVKLAFRKTEDVRGETRRALASFNFELIKLTAFLEAVGLDILPMPPRTLTIPDLEAESKNAVYGRLKDIGREVEAIQLELNQHVKSILDSEMSALAASLRPLREERLSAENELNSRIKQSASANAVTDEVRKPEDFGEVFASLWAVSLIGGIVIICSGMVYHSVYGESNPVVFAIANAIVLVYGVGGVFNIPFTVFLIQSAAAGSANARRRGKINLKQKEHEARVASFNEEYNAKKIIIDRSMSELTGKQQAVTIVLNGLS